MCGGCVMDVSQMCDWCALKESMKKSIFGCVTDVWRICGRCATDAHLFVRIRAKCALMCDGCVAEVHVFSTYAKCDWMCLDVRRMCDRCENFALKIRCASVAHPSTFRLMWVNRCEFRTYAGKRMHFHWKNRCASVSHPFHICNTSVTHPTPTESMYPRIQMDVRKVNLWLGAKKEEVCKFSKYYIWSQNKKKLLKSIEFRFLKV